MAKYWVLLLREKPKSTEQTPMVGRCYPCPYPIYGRSRLHGDVATGRPSHERFKG